MFLFLCFPAFRSSPVVLVRGAGSAALVAASEESSERSTGQSAPAAAHELHEALALSWVSTQTKPCTVDHQPPTPSGAVPGAVNTHSAPAPTAAFSELNFLSKWSGAVIQDRIVCF